MFKLVIQDDEGKTTVVPLIRDEITIGRKEGNTIRLTERNVSRKHAKISRANGAVAIEDLGSYNGVRVNGTRISQRTVLSISDRVQIGDYLIELKAEGQEQPVPYEDARTQPIERLDAAALGRAATPQPMAAAMVPQMALADTDPGARAAATAVPMTATAGAGNARMVVLSSNFAGREFQLTKAQMVIGRTDENDIVINHRSISRNHAKIVREPDTGRYTIMDLQSSNGVRVNNEDYGKVELRRGDMVDLGHVRMRFVEPGEDFVFGRDAQIVDVPTGGKKGWIFALLGLVVVGGIVVVAVSSGGGGKKNDGQVAAGGGSAEATAKATGVAAGTMTGSDVATGGGSAVATGGGSDVATGGGSDVATGGGSDVATGGAGTPAVDTAQVAKLMDDARGAMSASKWADASNAALAVIKMEPENADARGIADQAKRELQNQNEYDKFIEAIQRKQYEQAVGRFEKIAADSVYKNKARDQYDQLHTQYASDKKAQGQALAKAHKCKDLRKLAADADRVFPDVGDAIKAINCEELVAGGGGGGGGGGSAGTGGGSSGAGGGGGGAGGGGGDPDALLADAEAAAKTSQWARAMKLAEQSMGSKPSGATKARAAMVAALAACNLKNQSKAKSYYAMATPSSKTLVRQRCLSNGIEVQ
jgi:pSer/pThr/pTyr-binding forkhead associated (FHA) protein